MFIQLTLLSLIPYSISTWLVWQNLKINTILPYGSSAQKLGSTVGWFIKIMYFGTLIVIAFNYGWLNLITFPITWFVGNWIATIIERKLYMETVMNSILITIQQYENANPDFVFKMASVPEWWYKLMPKPWRQSYAIIIGSLQNDGA